MKAGPQSPFPEINLSQPRKQSSQPMIINHVSNIHNAHTISLDMQSALHQL